MSNLSEILGRIDSFVWGPAMLVLLLGTGIYLTIGLRFMSIRRIPKALSMAVRGRHPSEDTGEISPFQALTTALSATVGTGNIAGVATAIFIGGPGAVFWMWMTALVGMATKYSESMLSVKYREVDDKGKFVGGPMYYIKNGLGKHWAWLGGVFAFLAMLAGPGIGDMVQSNSVAQVVQQNMNIPPLATGFVLAGLTFAVIIGGIRSIANVAERVVPVMAFLYVVGALMIIATNITSVPQALLEILKGAFTPTAAGGGFAGAGVMLGIQMGVARGIFSNEAGLGSAPIAHAAARTNNPVRQGQIAMLGTFIDTLVICTMTALVILCVPLKEPVNVTLVANETPSGVVWQCPTEEQGALIEQGQIQTKTTVATRNYETCNNAANLSSLAFGNGIPGGNWIVTFGLIVFAFTTIIAWSYYGERAAEYLFGTWIIIPYRLVWVTLVAVGSAVELNIMWTSASIMNALMAIPNLIALILLSGTVFALTRDGNPDD